MAESSARQRAKRAQIRDGALAAFLDQGYAATSTDVIAKRAGVSKQTLYAYYRTKEDLLVDVLDAFVAEVEAPGEAAPVAGGEDLRERLLDLAEHTIGALSRPDYLALVRLIIGEGHRVARIGRLWSGTVPGRIRGTVTATLTAAATAGVVRDVPPAPATRLFVGALLTYVLPDALFSADPQSVMPDRAELGELVDLYLSALTERTEP